jgi:enoyl-CoA hydratase
MLDMSDAKEDQAVLTEAREGVLVITLNRPHRRNALNPAVGKGFAAALEQLDTTPDLHAGVLTGTGGHFCSGMDLKDTPLDEDIDEFERSFRPMLINASKKPLIAAVEGYAVAGGWELALACDMIVASEAARFGLPEVKVGLVAQGGALLWLPRRIPYHLAMELCITGRMIDAPRAAEIGAVNAIAPEGAALERALELAAEVAANAPLAVVATKQVVKRSYDWTADDEWERQEEFAMPVFHSADAAEGSLAFAEKRPPRWHGR